MMKTSSPENGMSRLFFCECNFKNVPWAATRPEKFTDLNSLLANIGVNFLATSGPAYKLGCQKRKEKVKEGHGQGFSPK